MPKNKIAEILGYTNDEYFDLYVQRYMRWLIPHVMIDLKGDLDNDDMTKLFANSAINKYYNERFYDLENQAKEILFPQELKITISTARRLYENIMMDISGSYPKVLFDEARKLKIDNNLN